MKKLLLLVCCIALSACGRFYIVPYQPNANAIDPAATIERALKTQPPTYTTVPYEISVDKDCIQMRLAEEHRNRADDISKTICYENIGKVILINYKNNISYVEIYDRLGYWMYTVYSFEEHKSKQFIDALHTMMRSQ